LTRFLKKLEQLKTQNSSLQEENSKLLSLLKNQERNHLNSAKRNQSCSELLKQFDNFKDTIRTSTLSPEDINQFNVALKQISKEFSSLQWFLDQQMKDKSRTVERLKTFDEYEKEWKGDTQNTKYILASVNNLKSIYEGIHIIKGDNFCGLRATLFSLFINCSTLPNIKPVLPSLTEFPWIKLLKPTPSEDWMKELVQFLIDTIEKLRPLKEKKQRLEKSLEFFSPEADSQLMNSLKLLMVIRSIERFKQMKDQKAPEYVSLLFGRDEMENPEKLMMNSIRKFGDTLGIEQVELFLLSDALGLQITVHNLNIKDDIPSFYSNGVDHNINVPIVTVDGRHYNVLSMNNLY